MATPLVVALLASPLPAQVLSGYAQVQYQQQGSAGITRRTWIQSYELNHELRLTEGFRVLSQLSLQRSDLMAGLGSTLNPRGTLRVQHALFGAYFSRLPSSTTDALGSRQDLEETTLQGYLAAPRLPRVELSYAQRRRAPGQNFLEQRSSTRSARVSQEIGLLNWRLGYQLQEQGPGPARTGLDRQRSLDGGANLRLDWLRAAPIQLQFDFGDTRRGPSDSVLARTSTQSASLQSGARISKRTDWSLSYFYRRTEASTSGLQQTQDHEGSATLGFQPTPATRLMASAGLRTVRENLDESLVGYVSALASARGNVRPGWRGSAEMSQSLNTARTRTAYLVSIARASSRMDLTRGIEATLDAQASMNSDSLSAASRAVGNLAVGLATIPWRGLYLNLALRTTRSGTSLVRAASHSEARSMEMRWQPIPPLQVAWSLNASLTAPDPAGNTSASMLSVDWRPSSRFQCSGTRTHSSGSRFDSHNGTLRGNELYGLRVLADFGRNFRSTATLSLADPRTPQSGNAFNFTLTRLFGR